MARFLRCRDIGMDCDFEAQADTEPQILEKVLGHLQTTHNMKEMSEELVAKARAAIRDEEGWLNHLRKWLSAKHG